ncbi:hypothetical protein VTK73DRAFT_3169 [Phialemonium thermophilum]|uniref:Uncharacterized protein n=1 Tax=Phialemonium thermophilum TaxID=223376 RepID=A0ABR3VK36_9PEZI
MARYSLAKISSSKATVVCLQCGTPSRGLSLRHYGPPYGDEASDSAPMEWILVPSAAKMRMETKMILARVSSTVSASPSLRQRGLCTLQRVMCRATSFDLAQRVSTGAVSPFR